MQNSDYYTKYYSESSFWEKVKKFSKKAGVKVIYPALLLYNVFTDSQVNPKIRLYIGAGLGYFILPVDLIPDFAPILGFTDDLSVLLMTLNHVRKNITDAHRAKARETLTRWFSKISEEQLLAIDEKIQQDN
jgi:uncharacterized membrane protein YkvA (DUF1232 family)